MSKNQEEQTEVLIVGAGPVGLALAIELGHRGVSCIVVERNDRVGLNPRAKTTNVRTREHLRRWGIADELRRVSKLPADFPSDVIFATRLNGPQLAKIENANNCSPERNDLYSESAQWVPQYALEEVMRAHAVTLPSVEVRFGAAYVAAQQDKDSVTTTVERDGSAGTIRSKYLVGADGARSTVRDGIGVVMEGKIAIAQNINIQFYAPQLAKLNPHGRAIMYWLINSEVPSVLGPMESEDHWYFGAPRFVGNIGEVDPKDLIRRATNLDFEMEIQGISPWAADSLIANTYSQGRIFLAGDACHLHPPFGGYGMNMGVADAVDLGWKMGAVLKGWGGEDLLSSYETERRPIHKQVIEEAVFNYNVLGNHLSLPGIEAPGPVGDATRRECGDVIYAAKLREFKTLGVILGYRYAGSPIIVEDGTEPPMQNAMVYRPSSFPGCLAPHLWLQDGSSLYDHFGEGFTLLAVDAADDADLDSKQAEASKRGVPLNVICPQDSRLKRRYTTNFALIRPDQHVAWRGDSLPEDFSGLLKQVTGYTASDRWHLQATNGDMRDKSLA